MDISKTIKEFGYTQEQVAKKLGITRIGLTKSLNGNPTIGTLKKVADIIGCKVGDFFRDEITSRPQESSFTCPKCGAKLSIKIEEVE